MILYFYLSQRRWKNVLHVVTHKTELLPVTHQSINQAQKRGKKKIHPLQCSNQLIKQPIKYG